MKLALLTLIAFSLGFYANEKLTQSKCLIQNIILDKTLSVTKDNYNCYITNVTFKTSDIAMVIQ